MDIIKSINNDLSDVVKMFRNSDDILTCSRAGCRLYSNHKQIRVWSEMVKTGYAMAYSEKIKTSAVLELYDDNDYDNIEVLEKWEGDDCVAHAFYSFLAQRTNLSLKESQFILGDLKYFILKSSKNAFNKPIIKRYNL